MKVQKILIPLDGSPLAETAIAKAIELADSHTSLVLMRAAHAHGFPYEDPVEAQVGAVREAEEYLAAVARRFADAPVKTIETSVWYGPAASSIIEAARFRDVDLIVMSTHGRSGLGRLILGSVAECVVRGTATPVLLLRADGAPLERPRETGKPAEMVHA